MALKLGTFLGEPDPPQTLQLLGDRVLNELAPARKPPPFDELVDLLESLWVERDGDLGAAHAGTVSPMVVPEQGPARHLYRSPDGSRGEERRSSNTSQSFSGWSGVPPCRSTYSFTRSWPRL